MKTLLFVFSFFSFLFAFGENEKEYILCSLEEGKELPRNCKRCVQNGICNLRLICKERLICESSTKDRPKGTDLPTTKTFTIRSMEHKTKCAAPNHSRDADKLPCHSISSLVFREVVYVILLDDTLDINTETLANKAMAQQPNPCDKHIAQAKACCEAPSTENCGVAAQVSQKSTKDKTLSVVGTAALPILNVVDKSSKALASHLLTCAKGVTRSAEVTYNLRAFKEACERENYKIANEIAVTKQEDNIEIRLQPQWSDSERHQCMYVNASIEEAVALEEQADQGLTDTMKYTSCYNAVSEAARSSFLKNLTPAPSTDSTLDTSNLHS